MLFEYRGGDFKVVASAAQRDMAHVGNEHFVAAPAVACATSADGNRVLALHEGGQVSLWSTLDKDFRTAAEQRRPRMQLLLSIPRCEPGHPPAGVC